MSAPESEPEPTTQRQRRRSPRHVKAAATLLQKEARRIVKRHAERLGPKLCDEVRAAVAAIDTQRAAQRWDELETEAERLDDLLQTHARFARKSALWETVENVVLAVGVALMLRSCFYEPFKIPSGSMKPTLREGDHIFVNKFRYGVQIPFTTTIVAADMIDEIRRGEVVVFRFPLDPSEDFIKRVIGLPGDTIRVDDGRLSIRRPGDSAFVDVPRRKLDTPCDVSGVACALFEETLDDRKYVVRYLTDDEPHSDQRDREITVPAGHLLVMGDNRNESMDSLQWHGQVEAVAADRLLTMKDLRDLTSESVFSVVRPSATRDADPARDEVEYLANRRASERDLSLEVWRSPTLGAKAVFAGAVAQLDEAQPVTVQDLLERAPEIDDVARLRAAEAGSSLDALVISHAAADSQVAVFMLEPGQAVFRLACGSTSCQGPGSLALRIGDVLRRYQRDPARSTRELIDADEDVRYTRHWRSRELRHERFLDASFATQVNASTTSVRLRAWRRPEEGAATLRSAALAALGSSKDAATAVPKLGPDAWRVTTPQGVAFVVHDVEHEFVYLLECARSYCSDDTRSIAMLDTISERVADASADRRKLRSLLTGDDVDGLVEREIVTPDMYEWERISLEATMRGGDHSVALDVSRNPAEGLDAVLARWRNELAVTSPREDVQAGAVLGESDHDGYRIVFAVRESNVALSLTCRRGLCPSADTAASIARRIADKAADPTTFVDAGATRPRPFVPRGNVKGRAERIWLPLHRFWRAID